MQFLARSHLSPPDESDLDALGNAIAQSLVALLREELFCAGFLKMVFDARKRPPFTMRDDEEFAQSGSVSLMLWGEVRVDEKEFSAVGKKPLNASSHCRTFSRNAQFSGNIPVRRVFLQIRCDENSVYLMRVSGCNNGPEGLAAVFIFRVSQPIEAAIVRSC